MSLPELGAGRGCLELAMMATLLISSLPTAILLFLPARLCTQDSWIMTTLLAFAAGGMLGDVFLHMLPHLSGGHQHQHQHQHSGGPASELKEMEVGLTVLAGFAFFYICELMLRLRFKHQEKQAAAAHKKSDESNGKHGPGHGHDHATGGLLNMMGDALHNLTDGIAIGASFSSGHALGVATTISTCFHEVPHELSDFAVLVQSGYGKYEAIGAQLLTAVAAFVGAYIGVTFSTGRAGVQKGLLGLTAVSSSTHSSFPFCSDLKALSLHFMSLSFSLLLCFITHSCIYPRLLHYPQSTATPALTGKARRQGGFIYIAATSVVPDVLAAATTPLRGVSQVLAFAAGVALMACVAMSEEHHHHQ
ncbi:unnamed protein product [Chrysoparadoxa australica]